MVGHDVGRCHLDNEGQRRSLVRVGPSKIHESEHQRRRDTVNFCPGDRIGYCFEVLKDQLHAGLAPDTSNESAVSKFGDLEGNWPLFFSILPLIWLESCLEEILDRGFLMNWIERMFSGTHLATVMAVVLQAMIFGFRHSYDLSERSITVGLIGLAMGIGYVVFGRNLWPLMIAHCALNTISMIDRVG